MEAIDRCIVNNGLEKFNYDFNIYEEEDFLPFDPRIKRTEATIRNSQTGE